MNHSSLKTLYIIGNGFDMHHGLDTAYKSFAYFLQDNHSNLHDYLINYFGLPSLDREAREQGDEEEIQEEKKKEALWSDFEKALADLDFQTILEEHTDYLPDIVSDDFREGDRYSYQIEMKRIVEDISIRMRAAFKEFILNVLFPENINHRLIYLKPNAVFFNFNYTNTLEQYYGVNSNRILYIHNKAQSEKEEVILGHGVRPENFRETKPEPPAGLSEEELYWWQEEQSDNYDYSFELGKEELLKYFYNSYKPTDEVIARHKDFFDGLQNIEQVYVLGHSLAPVDRPYFVEIINAINKPIPWHVSFFWDDEKPEKEEALLQMGLPKSQIQLIKIDDLIPKQPTLL